MRNVAALLLCAFALTAAERPQGFGANTPGGAGGRQVVVTTLADSGPGSLREAVEASGPRVITFRVAGEIHLERTLAIRQPFITIDASTAPAPGITLRDNSVFINTHDVIIRYMRSRPGDKGKTRLADVHAFSLAHASNVLFDHCSAFWGIDENIGMYQCRDITVSWCILAEALFHNKHEKGPHSMGILVGGDQTDRVTIHHCLFASNNQRNPRLQNGVMDVRNNVFYNPGSAGGYFSGNTRVNFVGNLYVAGPDTKRNRKAIVLTPEVELYLADSALLEGGERITGWDMVTAGKNATPKKAAKPFDAPVVDTLPLDSVHETVLAGAGATLPVRDAADERVVRGVRARTHRIIDTPDQLDVHVTGGDLAWKIETAQLVADLSKNPGTGRNGQINTIFVKDAGVLLTRARPTSTLHLSPNAAVTDRWAGINRWDPPKRFTTSRGPGTFRVEREGEMPNVPQLWVKTAYEFAGDSPSITVEESIEATADAPLALLRMCEWSCAPGAENPFSHTAWEDANGNVTVRPKQREETLPFATRWTGFYSEAKRLVLAAVIDRMDASFLANESARFGGDPHYFYRVLVGGGAAKKITVPRGSRYDVRYRLMCYRPRDPRQPFAELKP